MDSTIEAATFQLYENVFTKRELRAIRDFEYNLMFNTAGVGKQKRLNENLRISEIARVPHGPQTEWIYDRFVQLGHEINSELFGFKLFETLEERFQYTVYHGDEVNGGHYTWHRDTNNKEGMAPRKLTLVLQLSDPSEYEGGLLQIGEDPDNPETLERKAGLIVAFPSWAKHRVTPVTSGTRRTLVLWFSGE